MAEEEKIENAETVETEEAKPTKRIIRRRKSKKEKENPIHAAIRLAVEGGDVGFGFNSINKEKTKSAKLLVLADNTPEVNKAEVAAFSKSSGVPVIVYQGSSVELGSICGKPFPISVLSVFEAGNSNLLELAKKSK